MRQAFALLAIGIGIGTVFFATNAQAQFPSSQPAQRRPLPQSKPSVSPYMNLLNNQNPNITNYQSLVRPQLNQARINTQQQSQISRLEAPVPKSGKAGSQTLRSTGHQATWNNYSHFYPKKGR